VTRIECEREADVLAALIGGGWPDRVDAELETHVAGCPVCADLVTVVRPLRVDQTRMRQETVLPPAHVVYWRAQLRARAEAQRTVSQPLTLAHAVALVGLGVLGVSLTPVAISWFGRWGSEARPWPGRGDWFARVGDWLGSSGATGGGPLTLSVLALAVAACLLLVSVAVYFVVVDE
jgi:hypothetical protein